jgi:hypothetical protein
MQQDGRMRDFLMATIGSRYSHPSAIADRAKTAERAQSSSPKDNLRAFHAFPGVQPGSDPPLHISRCT